MSALPSTLADENRVEALNDPVNKLREFQERWVSRLTLNGSSLLEKYLEVKLSLVCDLEISRRSERSHRSAIPRNGEVEIAHNRASVVLCANSNERHCAYYWKQELVFVQDVESVKCAQGIIPTRIRFYDIHDEVSDFDGGLIYSSAANGGYKFIPGIIEREFGVVAVAARLVKHNLIDGNVESTSEIVNCISNGERKIVNWNGFSDSELYAIVSCLDVFFYAEGIAIAVKELPDLTVKLQDVLLGPF